MRVVDAESRALKLSFRFIVGAALCFVFAGACGGGDQGAGPTGGGDYLAPMTSLPELRSRLENVWCDNIPSCCAKYDIDFWQEGCRKAVRGYVDGSGTFVGHAFDSEVASECVRLSLEAARSCLATFEQFAALESTCQRVMGRMALGESCSFQHNCAPSPLGEVRCRTDGCTVIIVGGPDDPCDELSPGHFGECDEQAGLYCEFPAKRCRPAAANGEHCGERLCAPELFCNTDVCEPQVAPGGACVTDIVWECSDESECRNGVCTMPPENSCGADSCTESEHCDSANDVCKPRLADGEPCAAGVCQMNSRCLCPSVRTCSTAAQRCFPGNLARFCWGDT